MIKLYNSTETNFSHNGIGILKDTITAEVKEELNGNFTLDLEYPLLDISSNLVRGNIIKCPVGDSREDQLFRIRNTTKDLYTIKVFAQHIAIADLGTNFIADTNIVGKTRIEALQQILSNTMESHSYTASGDVTTAQDNLRIVRYSPLKAIMGTEDNTLLTRYGGEIEFDNFVVKTKNQRGFNNGVLIAYGKNVTGIEETIDDIDLITSIIPEGANGLFLPEYHIDSSYINNYEKVYFSTIKFDNIGVSDGSNGEEIVTEAQALEKLRLACNKLYDGEKVDLPNCNYKVNFKELSKTEEYKNYAILEKVSMGDTVIVKHSRMNINLNTRAIKTTYDPITDKITEIELGTIKQDITDIIKETQKQINFTKDKILLEVSNLNNTIDSKIEITEGHIVEAVTDANNYTDAQIEITANSINQTITDTANGLQTQITQNTNSISQRVTNSEFESYQTQTANEISSKVSSSNLSSLISQNVDSVKVAFNGISPTLEVNANGLYITDGEFNITSDGRTIFKVQDGYHFNEWGIACRTAQAGGNYYIGAGSKYFNYNDSILFRPFGLYHESLQNPQLPLMLLTNTGRVEIRDLDANYFRGIAAQTGEFNGFIYSNDYISGANIINRSLREIKTNIVKYNENMAYDGLKGLNIYNFNMDNNTLNLGVIVDEAPLEITQLGGGEGADRKGINLYSYISYLAAALKTSITKIEDLENRLSTLEGL